MSDLSMDLRYTWRTFFKKPAHTAFIVLTLALGIGASTAIFTFTKAVFLRSLPLEDPDRLVSVFNTVESSPGHHAVSYLNYVDYHERNEVFTGLAAYQPFTARLAAEGAPEFIGGELVSGNYFDLLGVEPIHGRTFLPEEDQTPGSHPVVVLSHSLWTRFFNEDPAAVGSTVSINEQAFTIIGVVPHSFDSLSVHGRPEFFIPLQMWQQALTGAARNWFMRRGSVSLFLVGRLNDGTDVRQAEVAMNLIAAQMAEEHPDELEGVGVAMMPLAQAAIHPNLRSLFVNSGELVAAVVAVLLLIVCMNIANMLLTRALERSREMAVRASLGAGRKRLTRQLLTEGLTLALLGGAAGLLVAYVLRDVLWSLRPPMVGEFLDVSLDLRVLGFALVISTLTGVFFGLIPLFLVNKMDLVSELRQIDASHGHGRWRFKLRDGFVVVQVALSMAVLLGGALFGRSLYNMRSVDVGFETDNLILMEMNLAAQGYDEPSGHQYYRNVKERVEAVPGVRSASLARGIMLGGGTFRSSFTVLGRDETQGEGDLVTSVDPVSLGYFDTLGVALKRGRDFTAADHQEAPAVAIVNETLAKRFWPGGGAVGQRLRLAITEGEVEIVGVADDVHYRSVGQEPQLYVYLPSAQAYNSYPALYVRTEIKPERVLSNVRREVQALDPELALQRIRTMADVVDQALWAARLGAGLLGLLSLFAMILAASGIYAIMAYSVRQRRREVGIRMAMGAKQGDLLKLFLWRAMTLVASGLTLGLVASFLAAPRVSGLLFESSISDPLTLGGAITALTLMALIASFLPARRSCAVDPVSELRSE